MKTTAKIIFPIAAILMAVVIMRSWNKSPTTSVMTVANKNTSMNQMQDAIPVEPIMPDSPTSATEPKPGVIPAELIGATKDPAVVSFFKRHNIEKEEIGDVRDTTNHTQQLYFGGKMVFEAIKILRRRSLANDGTIALAAVTETNNTATNEEAESELMSSIWTVDPSGVRKQISPEQIKATAPLISSDGQRIAFSGNKVELDGSEGPMQLFVFDVKTKHYRKFGAAKRMDSYTVGAAEWSADGQILSILENHGETGGHMEMKLLHL